ncbi:LAFA_0B08240g1_1 [Lachancea sp. 'fantastica']|nr:LAFA_0B08240g1_1 [Lachancea sp. 'fantastica']
MNSRPISLASSLSENSDTLSKQSSIQEHTGPVQKNEDLNKLLIQRFEVEDSLCLNAHQEENAARGELLSSAKSRHTDNDETIVAKVFTNKSTGELDLPPDGGYGWVCCICVTLIMFSTWGSNAGFGVFLAYYIKSGTFPGATKYDYALIAGMTAAFGQGMAPVAMFLTRLFGCKPPMYVGIVTLFSGFILASFATKLWQLYLTQGVLVGISIALLYAPATTIIPGWFLRKRSSAIGISFIGTGAGGVTYAVSVGKLLQQSGSQAWPLRMMAISCTITCIVSTILLKPRNPPKPAGIRSLTKVVTEFKSIFSTRVTTIYRVDLVAVWFAFSLLGYNLVLFTLSPSAVAKGLSSHQASILTTCMNAAQTFGRPMIGYSGDKLGRINVTVFLTAILIVFVFIFWITAHNFVQLLMFSICVGSCMGVANVMGTVLVADIVDPADFLPAWSLVNALGSPLLLVCELVAQALTDPKHPTNPYLHTQIFAGLCFLCALLLIAVFRELRVRNTLEQVRDQSRGTLESSEGNESEKEEFNNEDVMGRGPANFFRRMFYPMKL